MFDDLEGNLQQYIETFGSEVDASDSAVIKSDYLQEVKEDINKLFEDLQKQDEIVHDIIQEVSDISPAASPSTTAYLIVAWVGVKLAVITLAYKDIGVLPQYFQHSAGWTIVFLGSPPWYCYYRVVSIRKKGH